MDRATYRRLTSILRVERRKIRAVCQHHAMADSVLVVQQSEHNEYVCKVNARIRAIEQTLPQASDPLGFRKMYYRWAVAKAEAMRLRHWRTMQTEHFHAMKKASRQAREFDVRAYA